MDRIRTARQEEHGATYYTPDAQKQEAHQRTCYRQGPLCVRASVLSKGDEKKVLADSQARYGDRQTGECINDGEHGEKLRSREVGLDRVGGAPKRAVGAKLRSDGGCKREPQVVRFFANRVEKFETSSGRSACA